MILCKILYNSTMHFIFLLLHIQYYLQAKQTKIHVQHPISKVDKNYDQNLPLIIKLDILSAQSASMNF